jgi:hypothetical protein
MLRNIAMIKISPFFVAIFWYISLFPGRLPFDSSDAIRMIKRGESTEQWTPLFFWLLRITTLEGTMIWLSSALLCSGFFYAFKFLIDSLNFANLRKAKMIHLAITLFPVYGFWSVTVSHDSTFLIGFVMALAILIRSSNKGSDISIRHNLFAVSLLLTSWVGYVIVILFLISLATVKMRYVSVVALSTLALSLISQIGITSTRPDVVFRPALVDIKCAVQHPDSIITKDTWSRLEAIAPRDQWLSQTSCASMDKAVQTLYTGSNSLDNLQWREVAPVYLQLLSDNPAIILMGHIQRSSVALPPLLFQPPKNQVSWNLDRPVGEGTNTMLQQGPEVVHPSVDEPSVDLSFPGSKVVEIPAQLLGFLVNQASWFWGWGGLWLLPTFYMIQTRLKRSHVKKIISLHILLFHAILFALMPDPTPRYVLPSILLGFFSTCVILIDRRLPNKTKS